MWERVIAWGPEFHGSTRAVSLVRIGIALVLWARYGRMMALHQNVEPWQVTLSIFFMVFSLMMLIGWHARLATAVMAAMQAFFYFGLDEVAHHTFLLMSATALLSLTPCGGSYSVDRYRAVAEAEARGERPPPEEGPLWAQRLIVLQMAALYFWTAIDKTGAHFLSGERLEAIMIWAHSGKPLQGILLNPTLLMAMAIAVTVAEYLVAFGILFRRSLIWAVPTGIALHAAFFVVLPLSTFSISMILLYLLVIPPDVIHRVIERMHGGSDSPHRA